MKTKTLNRIVKQTIANNGATFTHKGKAKNFKNGFCVSLNLNAKYLNKGIEFSNADELESLIAIAYDEFIRIREERKDADAKSYFGLWIDKDKIWFDYTIIIKNADDAIKIAKKNKQLAIFDNKNKSVIELKGY